LISRILVTVFWEIINMGNIRLPRESLFNPELEPRLSLGPRQPFFRMRNPGMFCEMEIDVNQQVRFISFCPQKFLTNREMVLAVIRRSQAFRSRPSMKSLIYKRCE
jgi:hypothetical protein